MHLTTRSTVRNVALALMAERIKLNGKPKFTKCSADFLAGIETEVLMLLKRKIAHHPTIGHTLINY